MDFLDEVLSVSHCLLVAKLWTVKVGSQKKYLDLLGLRLHLCSSARENTRKNQRAQKALTLIFDIFAAC